VKLEGRVFKDGKYWVSEVDILDLCTFGTSKKDAALMMADAIQELIDTKGFKAEIDSQSDDLFTIKTNDNDKLISLILKRQRVKRNLSIADVVNRLGFSSRNAYARYENSRTKISFSKFIELYKTITQDEPVLKASK
jgi:predicted RNase H-like HicB family nuclease